MVPWLSHLPIFPPAHEALTESDGAAGLLAAGGVLNAEWLLAAYQKGIFPWYSDDQPILWWCPNPRMVLYTDEFKQSKNLQKTLRKVFNDPDWQIRMDQNFPEVMRACAQPRQTQHGTWISDDILFAYSELAKIGCAHSVETYFQNELVGGLYGVAIGRMFYGESMFCRKTDASKIALAYLVEFLKQNNVEMIDCQQNTSHLASLGAREISRETFLEHIASACKKPPIVNWNF